MDGVKKEISEMLQPCGLHHARATTLVRFTGKRDTLSLGNNGYGLFLSVTLVQILADTEVRVER